MDSAERLVIRPEPDVVVPSSVDIVELYRLAERAREHAYAPYSGLPIGAAIQWRDGVVSVGTNVENSSYGLTICAERVAAVQGAANGQRHIEAVVVTGDPAAVETFSPCGACRQFLREFDQNGVAVLGFRDDLAIQVWNLHALLPVSFRLRAQEA